MSKNTKRTFLFSIYLISVIVPFILGRDKNFSPKTSSVDGFEFFILIFFILFYGFQVNVLSVYVPILRNILKDVKKHVFNILWVVLAIPLSYERIIALMHLFRAFKRGEFDKIQLLMTSFEVMKLLAILICSIYFIMIYFKKTDKLYFSFYDLKEMEE